MHKAVLAFVTILMIVATIVVFVFVVVTQYFLILGAKDARRQIAAVRHNKPLLQSRCHQFI